MPLCLLHCHPLPSRNHFFLLLATLIGSSRALTLDQNVQSALLHAIANPSKPLRQTAGTSVAVIVGVGGLQTWPDLLATILRCLDSNDQNLLEGGLDALYKVSHTGPTLGSKTSSQCARHHPLVELPHYYLLLSGVITASPSAPLLQLIYC